MTLGLALVVAPVDAVQGEAQRLMYVHVPAAWTAYLCFATVLVTSLGYLRGRQLRWDRWARAAAEVGVALTALTLITGGLWGIPTWGTWWTWDARIMSTAAMLLVYVGYLAVRHLDADAHIGARRAAAVGAFGFLTIPLVHFSVLWWRTLHQPPTILAPSTSPPIDPMMGLALATSVLTFTALAGWVVVRRVSTLRATDKGPTVSDELAVAAR